jgi:glycosidase
MAPQVPLLFYGEEVGMEGDVKRPKPPTDLEEWVHTDRVFPWDGTQNLGFPSPPTAPKPLNASQNNVAAMKDDPRSLLSYVKEVLALRKTFPITSETKLHVSTSFFGAMTAYTLATPQGGSFKCRTVVVNMSGGGPWTVNVQHQGAECASFGVNEVRAENASRVGASGATASYKVQRFAKVVVDSP